MSAFNDSKGLIQDFHKRRIQHISVTCTNDKGNKCKMRVWGGGVWLLPPPPGPATDSLPTLTPGIMYLNTRNKTLNAHPLLKIWVTSFGRKVSCLFFIYPFMFHI